MGQSNELPRLVFHVFGTRGVRQTPPLREEESGDGMHSELYIKAAGFLLIQTHTHKLSMLTMKAAPPPPTHYCLPSQANCSGSRGHARNSAADHTDTRSSDCLSHP